MNTKDFVTQLELAVENRDENALANLEKIASFEPSLSGLWEEHRLLEEAIGEWKTKSVEPDLSFAHLVKKKIDSEPVRTVRDWEPVPYTNPVHTIVGSLAACVVVAICGFLVWNGRPVQDIQNSDIIASNPTQPETENSNDVPVVKSEAIQSLRKKGFSGLLREAGQSYGSLAEATADSVKEGSDLLPPVESWTANVSGSLKTRFWPSSNTSSDGESKIKKQLFETWNLLLQENDRG